MCRRDRRPRRLRHLRVARRAAIACVGLRWNAAITRGTNEATGKCVITNATTTLAAKVFLLRWRGRTNAPPALVKWWRSALLQSATHEARHITIQKRHLAAYRRNVKGKPCGSASALLGRHDRAANKAQAAFDARASTRPLPSLP
jgi:predicted secreted Zn-dependent protease